MRHLCKGRKLKRTSSHKKALMNSLATALFEHKKISTTEAKAKELRPFAEKLITRAKIALAREQQGKLPNGHNIDVHNRREVGRHIRNKAVLQELFDAIAPVVEERAGGYTRIIKTGTRLGDGGRTAIIELVDWSAPQDGAKELKGKKKRRQPKKQTQQAKAAEQKPEAAEEQPTEEAPEAVEETTEVQQESAPATEETNEAATETTEAKTEETAEEVEKSEAENEEKAEEAAEEPKSEEDKKEDDKKE
jgi:large subunit ribosomal protein L17